jgi:hypothetical protein
MTWHLKRLVGRRIRLRSMPVGSTGTVEPGLIEAALLALEYFEDREDVQDGDYGVPVPNREMQLASLLRHALGLNSDEQQDER